MRKQSITLIPAYGRDYRTPRDVMKAWTEGKDFQISDVSAGESSGRYCSIRDFTQDVSIKIRYNRLQDFVFTTGQQTDKREVVQYGGIMPVKKITPAHPVQQSVEPRPRTKTTTNKAAVGQADDNSMLAQIATMLAANPDALEKINILMQGKPLGSLTVAEAQPLPRFDLVTINKWEGHMGPQRVVIVRPDKGAQMKMGLRIAYTLRDNFKEFLEFMEEVDQELNSEDAEVVQTTRVNKGAPAQVQDFDDEEDGEDEVEVVNSNYRPLALGRRLLS